MGADEANARPWNRGQRLAAVFLSTQSLILKGRGPSVTVEFVYPWFLLLLPVPVVLLLWRRRRRRAALRYSSLQLFAGIRAAKGPSVGGEALRFLALTALLLALAMPRTPDLKTRVPTEGISIMFVLDTSGSMEEPFRWDASQPPITRREAAQRAFQLFVAGGDGPDGTHFDGRSTERGTDALGLVTFATWPQPVCPPTANHSVMLQLLNNIRPATGRDTNTNIGDALAEGILRLQHTSTKRNVLILLSDGEHNHFLADPQRDPLRPRQAAALAANLNIPIYTIDVGGAEPTTEEASKNRLEGQRINQAVAEMTKGQSFTANDGGQLLAVCQQIDQLERGPILSAVYRRYHEYYPWCALASFTLALLAFVLKQTRWQTIP